MKFIQKNALYIFLVIFIFILGAFFVKNYDFKNTDKIVDGTNCDTTGCDADQTSASTTKDFYDANLKAGFKYTDNLYIDGKLAEYLHIQAVPPTLTISTDPYVCNVSGNQVMQGGLTYNKNIDGTDYCVTVESEGAAGSTYTTYTYKKNIPEKNITAIFTFIIRAPQCGNFDQPQATNCDKEKQIFNVDDFIKKSLKTLYFK